MLGTSKGTPKRYQAGLPSFRYLRRRFSRSRGVAVRIIGLIVILIAFRVTAFSQQLIDAFEVSNRVPRPVPVLIDSFAIVVRDPSLGFNPVHLRLTRCDTKLEVPFYLEPWQPGADSVMCWVRINNAPASRSTFVLVELDRSLTVSKSNGAGVFLTFQDTVRPTSAIGPSGPWNQWQGAAPTFGRGLIIDARITALAPGGGYFCYFGDGAAGSAGYSMKHEARPGNTEPDHLKFNQTSATPVPSGNSPATYIWNVNEPVRYNVILTPDSNIVYRTSELDPKRQHQARTARDTSLKFAVHGVASLPGASQTLGLSYARSRPIYEFKPRTTRRGATIIPVPSTAAICNGAPVLLQAPATGWRKFLWSTGDTTSSINVTKAGSYYVDISDGGSCSVRTPTVVVRVDSVPSAGNDTTITLCLGRTETLRVRPGFDEYEWLMSSGQKLTRLPFSGPSADIDSADVYRCLARSNGGCIDTVRFVVNRVYDTTAKIVFPFATPRLCLGDSLLLRAEPPTASQFSWSRNGVALSERSSQLVVRDSGTYTVAVRIGDALKGCVSVSTIKVLGGQRDTLRIPARTDLCEGDSVVLDAGGFPQVEWWRLSGKKQTLITAFSRTLVVNSNDTIMCIGSNNGSCYDTAVAVVNVLPSPTYKIDVKENKRSLCIGEVLTLRSNAKGVAYQWRLADTLLPGKSDSAQISITLPGTYSVTVDYGNSCKRSDTIVIDNGLAPPNIVALDGQAICRGDSTRLTTLGKFGSYEWSTGERTDTIWARNPGTYTVRVTLFGCESFQSILIEEADPNGPTITYKDSTIICPGSRRYFIIVRNNQNVPRIYNSEVTSNQMFTIRTPTIKVEALDTAMIEFEMIDESSTERFLSFTIRLSDDCRWSRSLSLTVENRAKTVPLEFEFSKPLDKIRASDVVSMKLRGFDARGLQDFRSADTLWIRTSLSSDIFEIQSVKTSCAGSIIDLDEPNGTVLFALTGCAGATANPLIEQTLGALVSESLFGFLSVDTVYSTSPCITAPINERRYDWKLSPYGCELSTIARTSSIILGIGAMTESSIIATISEARGPVTIRTVDVLGRVIDSQVLVPGQTQQCELSTGSGNLFYLSAIDETSVVTLPVSRNIR